MLSQYVLSFIEMIIAPNYNILLPSKLIRTDYRLHNFMPTCFDVYEVR